MRTELRLQASVILEWVGPLLLCPSEVSRVPDGVSGIYMLHAFFPSFGGYAVFYVGRASDIRRRLNQHLGPRTTKTLIRAARELDQAWWSAAPVLEPELLASVETGLIRALRPICNAQVPRAEPLPVNLPPLSFRSAIIT
ncbi:MAG TPA: hypothetical protein VF856_12700 [Gemmatimonadaceae bacterium]